MADLRVHGDGPYPPHGRSGRPRAWLVVAFALVMLGGAVGVTALMAGDGSKGRPDASGVAPSPGAQASATAPDESAAVATTAPGSPSTAASSSASSPAAAGSSTTPSPLTGSLIALVDDRGALITVDERGGSRVSYPTPGLALGFPAWSPDGSRIAVVGQGADGTAILVFTVGGAAGAGLEPTVIYRSADQPPFYLYWTPDSRRVSFLTSETVGLALRVAPVDRAPPPDKLGSATIIRRGAPLYFDWVAVDRALLHVGGGLDAFTGQVGLDGATVGTPVKATGAFRTASLSGNGRFVAYATSAADGTSEIVVQAADGSSSRRMPAFGAAAMLFDPTSDTLATVTAAKPLTQAVGFPLGPLRLIDPVSGASRTLLDRSVLGFFWAPDGKTIAALVLLGTDQPPVATVARFVPARAYAGITDAQAGGVAATAGYGVSLVFVDVATGTARAERVVRLTNGFVGQLLPYFDQYALSHRSWSPDSASLLLPLVAPTGEDQVVVIPADGSDPRVIANGAKGFWSP